MLRPTKRFLIPVIVLLFTALVVVLALTGKLSRMRGPFAPNAPYSWLNEFVYFGILGIITVMACVEAVRLLRGGGAFARPGNAPQRIRLSPGEWAWLGPVRIEGSDALVVDVRLEGAPKQLLKVCAAIKDDMLNGSGQARIVAEERFDYTSTADDPKTLVFRTPKENMRCSIGIRADCSPPDTVEAWVRWRSSPRLGA